VSGSKHCSCAVAVNGSASDAPILRAQRSGDGARTVTAEAQAGGIGRDRLLVERLLAGDDAALAKVYDTYGHHVYGLARYVTASAQAASELTVAVFVRLWEHPDAVDLIRQSLRGFLAALCLHHRSPDFGGDAQDPAEPPESEIASCIRTLPADQRDALLLARFGALTYRQVADELKISEQAAKTRLRLALTTLAARLDPSPDGSSSSLHAAPPPHGDHRRTTQL
jgi:DNA-directed RNA polymerase specialized sigma24 family protein